MTTQSASQVEQHPKKSTPQREVHTYILQIRPADLQESAGLLESVLQWWHGVDGFGLGWAEGKKDGGRRLSMQNGSGGWTPLADKGTPGAGNCEVCNRSVA